MQFHSVLLRWVLLWVLVFGIFSLASGQDIIRIGITKTDLSQMELKKNVLLQVMFPDVSMPNALHTISDKLVNAYTNDPGFKVVDYRSYDLVSKERERQKGEEFIDGFIVEQGKSEGVDFILSPIYLVAENELTVRVIDIANGQIVCQASTPIIKNKTGPEYARYYSALLTQQLNNRCFNLEYPVVRILKEKGGDAKELLVAFGALHQAKEKQIVGIYKTVTETVGGEEVERQELVGEGEIDVVEDDNFSVVSVKKGGEAIGSIMAASGSLSLRILKISKK